MPGKQAKLLTDVQITACLKALQNRRHSVRNIAMLLLSTKAGLRAGEIAGLTWPMVSDSSGKIGKVIAVENRIAKKGSGRIIPMHAELRDVLIQLRLLSEPLDNAVIRSERGCAMSASSVANWFSDLYRSLGFAGCSSHSGRRTFITKAARNIHRAGGSIRDVQELAGHRSLAMTQRYIEGDTAAKRKLVALL
jgi:integrase